MIRSKVKVTEVKVLKLNLAYISSSITPRNFIFGMQIHVVILNMNMQMHS